jgi:hypothetical protein
LELVIRRVLEQEAPILDMVLVERVARAHGFKRSGRLIRERVLDLAKRHYHFQKDEDSEDGAFVWLTEDDVRRWNTFRVPQGDEDVRFIEEIPPEEIIAAAQSIKGDDVPIEIARAFGIRRLSVTSRDRIDQVIQGLSSATMA